MNQELHVAVQAAHKKKNILTLINIFACTRETIYFPLKIDAYNYSSFLQIQLTSQEVFCKLVSVRVSPKTKQWFWNSILKSS